jgi:hypothetical protein
MSEQATNFLGIPIDGDINRPRSGKAQRPREEFEPIVGALLDDPFFIDFGWRQYTPYFNDGDPCVFGANGFWVRTANDIEASDATTEDDDDDDPNEDTYGVTYGQHPTLGEEDGWGESARYVGDREAQWRVARALAEAIESEEFDQVLVSLFGDHCQVKVSRAGITVDEYSHD